MITFDNLFIDNRLWHRRKFIWSRRSSQSQKFDSNDRICDIFCSNNFGCKQESFLRILSVPHRNNRQLIFHHQCHIRFYLQKTGCLYEHLRWGDAFVVVYSICDRNSFADASEYLLQLSKLKLPSYYTTLLLGNKRDLDHSRWVWCEFCEVESRENLFFASFLQTNNRKWWTRIVLSLFMSILWGIGSRKLCRCLVSIPITTAGSSFSPITAGVTNKTQIRCQ